MKVIWESLPDISPTATRVLSIDADRFDGPLHAHQAMELTWIRAGQGMRFIDGSVEPFGEGDLVLIAPSVAHTWRTHGRADGRSQALVLQIRPAAELTGLSEWREIAPLGAGADAGWVMTGALREDVCERMLQMAALPPLARLGVSLETLARIAHALETGASDVRAIGLQSTPTSGTDPAQRRRLDALLGWIQRHRHTPIRTLEAARRLHVSPAAFSRAFKRLVGKPFSVYLNDLRIADACLALNQSDRPIADIAQRSGFAKLSNFNQQFRARTGLTPRQYRARLG